MKTRAAVLDEGRTEFEIQELEIDDPRGGEIQLRFTASGLCHSDLHTLDGVLTPRRPIVLGHEGAGVVERVGPGVTKVAPGDHVVCSFVPNCGTCRYCATGRSGLCDLGRYTVTGSRPDGTYRVHSGGRDFGQMCGLGTFSERATVSEHSVVEIDPWIPLDVAVLAGCGVPTGWGSATEAAGVHVGDTVVVYGTGGIGMNAVQGAAFAGAKFVVAVEPVAFKREAALGFGATHAFATAEEAQAAVTELTWGQGADQSIVTVGTIDEHVLGHAFAAIGKGGTMVVTSLGADTDVNLHLPTGPLTKLEKTVKGTMFGSMNPQYDIVKLLRLHNAGRIKLDELRTRTYALDEINKGYADLLAGELIRGVVLFD